ncbi:Uncharacterized protein FWK35_00024414, partial [Aphis craccivora]
DTDPTCVTELLKNSVTKPPQCDTYISEIKTEILSLKKLKLKVLGNAFNEINNQLDQQDVLLNSLIVDKTEIYLNRKAKKSYIKNITLSYSPYVSIFYIPNIIIGDNYYCILLYAYSHIVVIEIQLSSTTFN